LDTIRQCPLHEIMVLGIEPFDTGHFSIEQDRLILD
jgi:hypothetical protein